MKALNQVQLDLLQSEVQAEYEANLQKMAELEANQAELQRILYRCRVHNSLMAERAVPSYAPWLPFSN